jgi:hypothetical protein
MPSRTALEPRVGIDGIPSCTAPQKHYIGSIHEITAPPHGDVRPEFFLPSPGQDPIGARVKRIGEEPAGKAL